MSEMVEKVSAAVMAAAREQTRDYDDYPASGLDYDALARAAIEAMREPTAGMTKMAWRVYPEGQPDGGYVNTPEVAAELWGEMIDAALTTSRTE